MLSAGVETEDTRFEENIALLLELLQPINQFNNVIEQAFD